MYIAFIRYLRIVKVCTVKGSGFVLSETETTCINLVYSQKAIRLKKSNAQLSTRLSI